MFKLASGAVLAAALALAIPAAAQPAAKVEIVGSVFGVLNPDAPGGPAFTPSDKVSLARKDNYGWMIGLRTDQPTVHYREEFTLPAAPKAWSGDAAKELQVSKDRRTAVIERDVAPENGVIGNFWSVVDGDPKGHYRIRVSVEGGPAQTFDFDVE